MDPVASATPHYTQGRVLGYMGLGGSWRLRPEFSSMDHHSNPQPFCLPAQKSPGGPAEGPSPTGQSLSAGLGQPLPGLQGEQHHILLLPLLFLFQHLSGPGAQRRAAPVSHAMGLGSASRSFQILPACHLLSSRSLPILCPPFSVWSCSLLREMCISVPQSNGERPPGTYLCFTRAP